MMEKNEAEPNNRARLHAPCAPKELNFIVDKVPLDQRRPRAAIRCYSSFSAPVWSARPEPFTPAVNAHFACCWRMQCRPHLGTLHVFIFRNRDTMNVRNDACLCTGWLAPSSLPRDL